MGITLFLNRAEGLVMIKMDISMVSDYNFTQGLLLFSHPVGIPGLPVPHHLPKFTQVHVHCIGDAIQPSYPLTPSFPSAFNLSQHQGLFQ